MPSLFGSGPADFARCLSGVTAAACFSGGRPSSRLTTVGATTPGAPGSLQYQTDGAGGVSLVWNVPTAGDPVVTYVIEAGSATGLANLASIVTNSSSPSFSAKGVANGTYYVRVRAQNAAGTSPPSNEIAVVVGSINTNSCTSPPNAPIGVKASVSGGTVVVSWNLSGGSSGPCGAPSSYKIQFGYAPGTSDIATVEVRENGFTATGVPVGIYYARVIAFNPAGPSAPSAEISFTVNGAPETNISGRWVGVAPFGLTFNADAPVCDLADDLVFDLTQAGATVTGTLTATVRAAKSDGCKAFGDGALKSTSDGDFFAAPTAGGISSVRLSFSRTTMFIGQAAGGRITGTVTNGDGSSTLGVFTVIRQ